MQQVPTVEGVREPPCAAGQAFDSSPRILIVRPEHPLLHHWTQVGDALILVVHNVRNIIHHGNG